MWKIILFPQWNYEHAEKRLVQMEAEGYRLEYACLFWLFRFHKSSPRIVRYVFTYSFLKEWGMTEYEYELKQRCKANKVRSGFYFSSEIYRVTDYEQDISNVLEFRDMYLNHVMLQKIFLLGLFGILSGMGYYFSSNRDMPQTPFLLIAALMVLLVLYHLAGIIWIKIRRSQKIGDGSKD